MFIESLSQLQALESWATRKTKMICVNVIQETPDVKTFQFKSEDNQLFHFKPGQFIGIQLEVNNEKHNRSYTIASSPTRPHLLALTIKLDASGIVSPWLHKNIKQGSSLEIRGPAGRFNCMNVEVNHLSDKVLLISAGSGITPMMSMARFWCDQASNKDIRFLNWARATEDIIFRRELTLMDHHHQTFSPEIICTNPGLNENWLGRRGRINKNLLTDLVPDLNQRTVFCCGPEGFMQQAKECLGQLDFNMDYYFDETFDPGGKKKAKLVNQHTQATKDPQSKVKKSFKLTFKKSARSTTIEEGENLLEKIESEGISINPNCRAGNCGCCKVKKISGDTKTQNENGLMSDERDEGFILACTTTVHSDLELDL